MKKTVLALLVLISCVAVAGAAEDPIQKMTDETLRYFKPVKGSITEVRGTEVSAKVDDAAARPGMRVRVLRDGTPFIHPITGEVLGKTESTVGKIEFREVLNGTARGVVLEGDLREGDRIRISETKVRMVFCQDKNTDWYLADEYYRRLKKSGRIEMADTALETGDAQKVLEEAKRLGAEVALVLTARESGNMTVLRQRLYWVSDGLQIIDAETQVDVAFAKELKFGSEMFTPRTGEAVLNYSLPFYARLLVTGDFDGDGVQEIALSNGSDIRIFKLAVDLQPLWEIRGRGSEEHIWLDVIDSNSNGKDELLVTSAKGEFKTAKDDEVATVHKEGTVSYIYEYAGSGFDRLWEGKYFIRRLGSGIIAQGFSDSDGYSGDVVSLVWKGQFSMGEKLNLPPGVNIYDFVMLEGADRKKVAFAYDDEGYLNLYNEEGIKTWRSSASTGGFVTTFKKRGPVIYVDRGVWTVKDRLMSRFKEVLVIERIPLTDVIKTIGYKTSRIKNYWWNGLSMEENVFVDNIPGTALDYAIAGDKMYVLSNAFLGIKFGNILKGENPLGSTLSIYSIKGR